MKKKAVKKMDAPLIEILLRSIAELYPLDQTKPGLVLSHIQADIGSFYGSIVRYDHPTLPNGKQVLAWATGNSVTAVISDLAQKWSTKTKTSRALHARRKKFVDDFDLGQD